MPRWTTLSLTLMFGAFVVGGTGLPAYRCDGADLTQTAPTTAGRDASARPDRPMLESFLVMDSGYALLGPDGQEKERLENITNGAGAISPDGHWAAFSKSEPKPPPGKEQGQLVIQSRAHPEERRIVPLIWGTSGSSFLPLWSSDSRRILICEQGFKENLTRASAYRVYDLDSKSLTELKLPDEQWPSDWSADGKRILTSLRTEDRSLRVAWVDIDGKRPPEFVTADQEVAYGAKLSPDSRQILCMIGPKTPADQARNTRLYAIDLATKKRTMIDKPGHTHGYCWSSDGSKVAYTWQLPLRQPEDAVERKTYLVTCNRDGSNHKTVTMRKCQVPANSSGRGAVIIFFVVMSWWR